MTRNFEDILNDCIERVRRGEDVESCAGRYPAHADELIPLLRVAQVTMHRASAAVYTPEAKARGLVRLSRAIAEQGVSRRRSFVPSWRPLARPMLAGFAAVLITAVAAGGTTVAAADSVPGDALYWVKTTRENVSLRMPRSDMGKAEAHAQLASERGREMRVLITRGRRQDAERLIERMQLHLSRSAGYAGVPMASDPVEMPVRPGPGQQHTLPGIGVTGDLHAVLERNDATLRAGFSKLLRQAPPHQRSAIQRMMRQSNLRYRIYIRSLERDGTPQNRGFWHAVPVGEPSLRSQ